MKKRRLLNIVIAALLLFSSGSGIFTASTQVEATAASKQSTDANYFNDDEMNISDYVAPGVSHFYTYVRKNREFPKNAVLKLIATVNGKEYVHTYDRYSGLFEDTFYTRVHFYGYVDTDTPLKNGDVLTFRYELNYDGQVETTKTVEYIIDDHNYDPLDKYLPTPIISPITENDRSVEITIPNADQIDFDAVHEVILHSGFEHYGLQANYEGLNPDMINQRNEIVFLLPISQFSSQQSASAFDIFSAALIATERKSTQLKYNDFYRYSSPRVSTIVNERYPLHDYEIESPAIAEVKHTDDNVSGSTNILPYYLGQKIILNSVLTRADGTKITSPINDDGTFAIPVTELKQGEMLNIHVQASYNGVNKNGPTTATQVAKVEEVKPDPDPEPKPEPKPDPEKTTPDKIDTEKKTTDTSTRTLPTSLSSRVPATTYGTSRTSSGGILPRTGDQKNIWLVIGGIIILVGALSYPICRWRQTQK